MRGVLYGVDAYDLPTIAVVVLTLSVVTLDATTAPAMRVAKIDPAKALDEECRRGTPPLPLHFGGAITSCCNRRSILRWRGV